MEDQISAGSSIKPVKSSKLISERTCLLQDREFQKKRNSTTYHTELYFIFKKSFPLIVTFLLQYSLTVVSIYFTGKLGDHELGAGSLSITFFYITGPVIVNGFATCLDTLCSQAYGAKNYTLFCSYIQRCVIIMLLVLIPSYLLWWNSYTVLGLFVADEEILALTSSFLKVVSSGAPALVLFETAKRYLQSQGIFTATTFVLILSVPINITLNYFLILHPSTGIGFIGAPVALVLTYWLNFFLLLTYILFIDGSKIWKFNGIGNCFVNWKELIKLAIPGVVMIESESLAFQLLTFMAARINTNELNSQSIISTMASLSFQLPFAMAVCSSTRISHYIGSGEKDKAIISTYSALLCAIIAGCINFGVLFFGRKFIASLFTSNEEIRKLIYDNLPVVAFMQLIDCFNVLSAGCLRGQGRQKIGSYLSLLSYYMVAVPLEVYFAFTQKMYVKGLWIGLSIGVSFLSISEVYAVIVTDWNSVIEWAKIRNATQ